MTRSFILGGARSGKSSYAEQLAAQSRKEVVYIATGQARDAEMQQRIEHHQQRRPQQWRLVEQPIALAQAIQQWCAPERIVLVDCLTLWLSNLLFAERVDYPEVGLIEMPPLFIEQRALFLDSLASLNGDLIIVSNEVGLGIVPFGAVSRCYVDEAGRLNQEVAKRCENVVLVTAGLPLVLKGSAA